MFKTLIIDPNLPFRQSLRNLLIKNLPQIDVEVAADNNEGLEKLAAFQPHLVLLDVHLPGESGLKLARRIKSDHPEVIIALLTSYNLPEYHAAAKQCGIEHVVPKDHWTGEDIMALIDQLYHQLYGERR